MVTTTADGHQRAGWSACGVSRATYRAAGVARDEVKGLGGVLSGWTPVTQPSAFLTIEQVSQTTRCAEMVHHAIRRIWVTASTRRGNQSA